jgi:glycerol-3-phosphate acyltransferase PlsY
MGEAVVAGAVVLAGYGLGCVVAGWYLVRLRTGDDLRTLGSGSSGGRNVRRAIGTPWATVASSIDVAKGMLAAALAMTIAPAALPAAAAAVVAGHIWPVQLGFHGGRGFAPGFGSILVADAMTAGVAVAVFGALVVVTRRFSLSGLAAIVATPPAAWLLGRPTELVAATAVIGVLILLGHRGRFRAMVAEPPGVPT